MNRKAHERELAKKREAAAAEKAAAAAKSDDEPLDSEKTPEGRTPLSQKKKTESSRNAEEKGPEDGDPENRDDEDEDQNDDDQDEGDLKRGGVGPREKKAGADKNATSDDQDEDHVAPPESAADSADSQESRDKKGPLNKKGPQQRTTESSNPGASERTATPAEAENAAKRAAIPQFEYPLDHFGSKEGVWETAGYQDFDKQKPKIFVFVEPALKQKRAGDVTLIKPFWICYGERPVASGKTMTWTFREQRPLEVAGFDLLPTVVQQYLLQYSPKTAESAVEEILEDAKKEIEMAEQASSEATAGSKMPEASQNSADEKINLVDDGNGGTDAADAEKKADVAVNRESDANGDTDTDTDANANANANAALAGASETSQSHSPAPTPAGSEVAKDQGQIEKMGMQAEDIAGPAENTGGETGSGAEEDAHDEDAHDEDTNDPEKAEGPIALGDDGQSRSSDGSIENDQRLEPLVFLLQLAELSMMPGGNPTRSINAYCDMLAAAFPTAAISVILRLPSGESQVTASKGGLPPSMPYDLQSRPLTAQPNAESVQGTSQEHPPFSEGDVRLEQGESLVNALCCPVFEGQVFLGLVVVDNLALGPDAARKQANYLKVVTRGLRGSLLTLRRVRLERKAA